MTDQKDTKDKSNKLTLGGQQKLSLNRNVTKPNRTVIQSNSNTIIEVKKSKLNLDNRLNKISLPKETSLNDAAINSEIDKRLSLLKKAAESKSKEDDPAFSSLSKLAALNQVGDNSPIEKNAKDDDVKTVVEDIKISTPVEEIHNEAKPITSEVSTLIKDANGIPTKGTKIAPKSPTSQVVAPKVAKKVGDTSKKATDTFEEPEEKEVKKHVPDNKTSPSKKYEEKKFKKSDILHMLDGEEDSLPVKTRSIASIKRAKEKEKRKLTQPTKVYREVIIPENITVGELASRMSERASEVIKSLLDLGIVANINQSIDADTAELIVTTLGHTLKRVHASDVENVLDNEPDKKEELQTRPPVVTVVGHVDHGKTLLLDTIRATNLVAQEAGGITQHIGAYKVFLQDGKTITFIDTPGHEAFTAMRTRGVAVTDIVVLVVAADDGINTQTIEAINHAKAAKVPIIVAINKIDKPDTDIDKVKHELLTHELVSEEFGGDTIIVPISALKNINIDKLLSSILLVAEMLELKANPNAPASGAVIESKIDKGKGVISTFLIKRGTLHIGDIVIAGNSFGRVRNMLNDKGERVEIALPSDPIEVYGLNETPYAGDKFDVAKTEKQARDIIEYRKNLIKEKKNALPKAISLDKLFDKALGKSSIKELNIIIKADVQGSLEAIENSLLKIHSDEVKIKILHSGVGGITDSDIILAKASGAVIIGFNVRTVGGITNKDNVDIRYYSIIYNLIDDVRAIVSGMLTPIVREVYIGSADIREVFNITKVGKIAGCYITRGVIKKGAGVRLIRDNIVIHQGKLKTLKRFKDEVKEVKEGFECGIAFDNYDDIRLGDKLEAYEIIEEKPQLAK